VSAGRLAFNLLVLVAALWVLGWFGVPWRVGVAVVLLAPFWLGPIAVRLATRHPARPSFEPYDSSRHRVPDWALAFAEETAAALGRAGFTSNARFVEATWARHLTSFVTVLTNAASRDVAMAAALYTSQAAAARRVSYTEFIANLSDGRQLLTNNSATPSVFPPVPTKTLTRLPQVKDPVRLYRVHELLARRERAAKQPLPTDANFAGRLSEAMARSMDEQLRTGYMCFDAADGVYRPTWKGAVLMSWKLLPPWRQIRQARMGLEATRLLGELGV
jgi:hypothetical protein